MIGRIPSDSKREREESPNLLDEEEPIAQRVKVESRGEEEPLVIVDGVIVID
jgi:hypothetical protein